METVAFLAYYDDRWVGRCNVKPVLLVMGLGFQAGLLLWAMWSYQAGADPWWCVLRISISVILLTQLLGLALHSKHESLFKQLSVSLFSYLILLSALSDLPMSSHPSLAQYLPLSTRIYSIVFLLIPTIIFLSFLIKLVDFLLSLLHPRLHLRLHGYRED